MTLVARVGIACGIGGKLDTNELPKHPNEDAASVFGYVVATDQPNRTSLAATTDTPSLVLVADGLGGHAGGDRASREVALRLAARADRFTSPEEVNRELGSCHDLLREIATRDHATEGMGTTIAGIAFHHRKAVVFNIGDSRVYRMHAKRLVQVSIDDAHTPVSAGSNVITKALGTGSESGSTFVANQRLLTDLHDSDHFLLCSDGLSDYVSSADIERIFASHEDPVAIAHDLYGLALHHGSRDNVTVVVVSLADANATPSPPQSGSDQKPRRGLGFRVKRRQASEVAYPVPPGNSTHD